MLFFLEHFYYFYQLFFNRGFIFIMWPPLCHMLTLSRAAERPCARTATHKTLGQWEPKSLGEEAVIHVATNDGFKICLRRIFWQDYLVDVMFESRGTLTVFSPVGMAGGSGGIVNEKDFLSTAIAVHWFLKRLAWLKMSQLKTLCTRSAKQHYRFVFVGLTMLASVSLMFLSGSVTVGRRSDAPRLTRAHSRSTASRMSSWCPILDTPRSSSSWWVIRSSWSPPTFSLSKVLMYCWRQSSRPGKKAHTLRHTHSIQLDKVNCSFFFFFFWLRISALLWKRH